VISGQAQNSAITALEATSAPNAVRLTWAHNRANTNGWQYAVAMDGVLQQLLPPGTASASVFATTIDDPDQPGNHTVAVEALRLFQHAPDMRGRVFGNRIVAMWDASESANAFYNVSIDGGEPTTTAATLFISPELTAGTHSIFVSAIDAAGNESTVYSHTLRVPAIVPPVQDATATVSGGNIVLAFTPPAEATAIEIFRNINTIYNRPTANVITTAPVAILAGDATGWTTPATAQTHKFFIRARVGSRVSTNVTPVEIDLSDARVMAAPVSVEISQAPGGKARVTWIYAATGDIAPTSFEIEHRDLVSPAVVLATVAANVSGLPWLSYDITTDAVPEADDHYLAVVAVNGALRSSTQFYLFEPDYTPPVFASSLSALVS
jgi:hypothetical protein